MAGIGFELKKLFRRKGLFATLRAYGYAGVICTGPMLLGVLLQVGMLVLCGWAGAARADQDLLVCMVTYTLLASLTVTSFFSMPVTRFLADMLYEEQEQTILPSFWGSNTLLLVGGCAAYGIFLIFSGATLMQGLLCLWLFAEMIVNWNAMSYLTAVKDYRGILWAFVAAIGISFGLGYLLIFLLGAPVLEGFLFAITVGYGCMMLLETLLLHRYFPPKQGKPLDLSALGGPFFAVGVYRFVYQSGPVRPPCYYLGRADRHTGQGAVLRRALPRCTCDAGIFKHPDHHSQLCGLCGSQLLPQIPCVLQPV